MALSDVANVGDVKLGGRLLQIVPGSYREFAITPFAPRIATQNPSHGTLDAWQSETITDWSHGFGFTDALDLQGYQITSGNIDTRQPHELRLFSTINAVANPTTIVTCMADAYPATNSGLYIGLSASQNGTTVYRFDGSAMSAINGTGTPPTTIVTDLISSANGGGGNMLFVALSDTSDIAFKTWNGSAWDTPVANGYAKYFCIAGGYMWYADRTNNVYYSSDPTINGGWSAAIPVGWKHHKITALCEFNGQLYVGKENGLYVIDGVGTTGELARSVITFRDQIKPSDSRMKPMVEWNGYLYFRFWETFYRMSPGGALSEVTPPKWGVTFPYAHFHVVKGFSPSGKYLYYVAKRTDTAAHDLLAFDGIAHHRLAQITTAANGVGFRSLYLSDVASNARLWTCAENGTVGTLSYFNITHTEVPYDDYPTTGTHYLETSRFDWGLPEVVKAWKDVTLEMENVSSGRYASVAFATDDNTTFTNMGSGQAETGSHTGTPSSIVSVNSSATAWTTLGPSAYQTTLASSANAQVLLCTVPGISIPTGATITGVMVNAFFGDSIVNGGSSPNTCVDSIVKLVIGGTVAGTNMATSTSIAGIRTYGSSTDTWGNTLTVAQATASDFGVAFTVVNQDTQSRLVTFATSSIAFNITVYYTYFSRYSTLEFTRADGTVTNATTTSFTDSVNLSSTDDTWDGATVDILSGTGAGQTRYISSYNGGNKTATLLEAWDTTPDTTSTYQITWQSRKIRYRLTLTTANAAQTAVVKSFTQRFQPRPPMKRGWKFSTPAADNMENNVGAISKQYGAEELKDLAFFWRNVKAPMPFVAQDGEEIFVEVSEVNVTEAHSDPQSPQAEGNREYQLAFSLVEA